MSALNLQASIDLYFKEKFDVISCLFNRRTKNKSIKTQFYEDLFTDYFWAGSSCQVNTRIFGKLLTRNKK